MSLVFQASISIPLHFASCSEYCSCDTRPSVICRWPGMCTTVHSCWSDVRSPPPPCRSPSVPARRSPPIDVPAPRVALGRSAPSLPPPNAAVRGAASPAQILSRCSRRSCQRSAPSLPPVRSAAPSPTRVLVSCPLRADEAVSHVSFCVLALKAASKAMGFVFGTPSELTIFAKGQSVLFKEFSQLTQIRLNSVPAQWCFIFGLSTEHFIAIHGRLENTQSGWPLASYRF